MVSVIVATKNREKSLKRCLNSLKNQSFKDFEIVIERGGKSLVEARQRGFEKSKGEIVIFIDDDVEVAKDWLKEIVLTFKDGKVGGVTGPCIVSESEMKNRDVFIFECRRKYNFKFEILNLKSILNFFIFNFKTFILKIIKVIYYGVILEGKEKEVGRITKSGMWTPGACQKLTHLGGQANIGVDYLEACNMAIRRSLIEEAGGFDLNFRGTSEWCEVDLAFRIKRIGYQLVFNPKAVLYHHVSRTGVFKDRVNAKERMENFLRYYFKNKKTIWGEYDLSHLSFLGYLGNTARFVACLFFWYGYFLYKAITTRNIKWLGGLTVFHIRSIMI